MSYEDEELTEEEQEAVQRVVDFFFRKPSDIEEEIKLHQDAGTVGGFLMQCSCGDAVDDYAWHIAEAIEPLIRKREAKAWNEGYSYDKPFNVFVHTSNPYQNGEDNE